jgi:hypothetical protein
VNYLLVFGVAVFSSASGALFVALLHLVRNGQFRTPSPPEADSSVEKWGCE